MDEEKKPVEATTPVEAKETVTIPAEDYQVIMARLTSLENDSKIRSQVDDKNTANRIEELRRSGKLVKQVKVRKVDGKFVRKWDKMKQNEVFKDQDGRLIERQTVAFYLMEDGDTPDTLVEMDLRQWAVTPEYVTCEIAREVREEDGSLYFTVVAPDGQRFDVGAIYVN